MISIQRIVYIEPGSLEDLKDKHVYRLLFRPPGIYLPVGYKIETHGRLEGGSDGTHGTISYTRRLTKEEKKDNQLVEISTPDVVSAEILKDSKRVAALMRYVNDPRTNVHNSTDNPFAYEIEDWMVRNGLGASWRECLEILKTELLKRSAIKTNPPSKGFAPLGTGAFASAYGRKTKEVELILTRTEGKVDLDVASALGKKKDSRTLCYSVIDLSREVLIAARKRAPENLKRYLPIISRKRVGKSEYGSLEFVYSIPFYKNLEWTHHSHDWPSYRRSPYNSKEYKWPSIEETRDIGDLLSMAIDEFYDKHSLYLKKEIRTLARIDSSSIGSDLLSGIDYRNLGIDKDNTVVFRDPIVCQFFADDGEAILLKRFGYLNKKSQKRSAIKTNPPSNGFNFIGRKSKTEIKSNGSILVRSSDGWYSGHPQPQLYANPLDLEQQFNSKKFNLRCNSEGVSASKAREIILFTPREKLSVSDRERSISWLISKFVAGSVKLEDAGHDSKITEYLDNFFKYKNRLVQKDLNQYSYPSEIFLAVKPLLGKATKEFSVDPRKVAGAEFFRKDENGEIWIPRTVEASCALGKGTEWCTAKYPPNDKRNEFKKYNKDGPLYVFFDNRTGKRFQYHRQSDQLMDEDDNEFVNAEFINLLGGVYSYPFDYFGSGRIKIIRQDGSQEWYKEGNLHRDGDNPAVIYPNGSQYWYKDGKLHRDGDKPALILADGTQMFYKEGRLETRRNSSRLISSHKPQIYANPLDLEQQFN